MKVKFLRKCKYSEDGLQVKSVEKDEEAELTNKERGIALCKSGFCVEIKPESKEEPKPEPKEEPKPETKKQRKAREKAEKEDDFLS